MNDLCDKCSHKIVCNYVEVFEQITDRFDDVMSDKKYFNDFKWFSYTPHCKYFCESEPTPRDSQLSSKNFGFFPPIVPAKGKGEEN